MLFQRPITFFSYRALMVCMVFFVCAAHAAKQPSNTPILTTPDPEYITVLHIMGEQAQLEWHQKFRAGFKQGLKNHRDQFMVNEISYSMHRSLGGLTIDEQLEILGKKLGGRQIDYIVTDVSATQRALDTQPDFLPFAKRIFFSQNSIGTSDIVEISEDRSLIRVAQRYQQSIDTMLNVHNPSKVHVFGDRNSKFGAERAKLFQQAVAELNPSVPFNYYLDEDLNHMSEIISKIPANEAIYYLIVQRDSNGAVYTPIDALRMLDHQNNAPIFTFWEPMVGEGAIGGYMVSATTMGKTATDIIASYQQNTLPSINTDSLFEYVYDDRELFEHGISHSNLVENVRLLFPQKGYLEHHFNQIIMSGIGIILGLMLIAGGLYHRVKNREQQLQKAKVDAERANDAKSNFLATMSHELRTPVNAILGITSVLKDSPELTQETSERMGLVHRSAVTFTNMLNEILDLNKIQNGELELAPEVFNIAQLCRDSVALFTPHAQAKGLSLNKEQINSDQWVMADPLRLRQIITNLLGNAIKFTEQGTITVSCRTQRVGNKVNLTLKVKDTGIGIAKKDLPTIFDRFSQVDDSNTRRFQGTGLGLSIVHELTKLFGGQIRVESELGKGTCFTLSLSLAAAEAVSTEESAPTSPIPPAAEGLNILVVDDVEINRMVAEIILTKLGHSSIGAESGKEAIGLLGNRDDIDLVLMDLQMPELDGYETTRLLRENGFSKPIIALSANAQDEVDEACLAVGMNGYASKPIDINGLQELLDGLKPPARSHA